MFKLKTAVTTLGAGLLASALSAPASAIWMCSHGVAGHNHNGPSTSNFTTLPTAWDDVAASKTRASAGNPAPGSASWSVMGAGLFDVSGFDAHGGAATTVLTDLYAGGVDEITTIGIALDKWAAVSGFTNLGQVADGGGGLGAAGAAGGDGDIRVGAIFIDGGAGPNVLAHAYQPGTEAFFGAGGNIAGDVHMDDSNTWADCATAAACAAAGAIDYHTVMLHELGHALGLGHSAVVGSVMEAFYGGPRRELSADDIAGIQAIYGPGSTTPPNPTPAPATLFLLALGALGLGLSRKRA